MKLALFVLAACISLSTALEGIFQTPLDHFRNQDGRTARFRYDVNIDHYQENGALFFYISDAGQYSTEWIERGLIYDQAVEFGAALFTTDIRYFRENRPTESATLDELSFLSVDQVLGDIAVFVHTARRHLDNNVGKVFVWGTGLGGTLAVLARQKFPNLIDGAWSSNGIFMPTAFTTTVYTTLAENIREKGSDECGDRVTQAFGQIEELIARGDDASTLVDEFGICRPFNISQYSMDIGMFSEGLITQISSYFERHHHPGITSFCNAMSVIPSDPMRSLGRWIRFIYNADVGVCSNYDYAGFIQWTSDTDWNNPGTSTGIRQMLYLQCTQIGQLQITTSTGMFGRRVTEEYRQRICEDSFGEDYNFDQLYLNVEYLNILYGGQYPKVNFAIYTNGYLDPWVYQGITYSYEPDTYVVNVPGYSKWADSSSMNTLDSIVLYNAKYTIVDTFRKWYQNSTTN